MHFRQPPPHFLSDFKGCFSIFNALSARVNGFVSPLVSPRFFFAAVFAFFYAGKKDYSLFFAPPEEIVKRARNTKNKPNVLRRNGAGRDSAANDPAAAANRAGKAVCAADFFCRSPFFICTFKAHAPAGKNANRLADCAIFGGTPPKKSNSGMVIVPPPIPMPAGIPPRNPSNKYR